MYIIHPCFLAITQIGLRNLISCIFLVIVASVTTAHPSLTLVQQHTLALVYEHSKEYGFPHVMQAIALKESQAGLNPAIGGRDGPRAQYSYGVMQVQLIAAKTVMDRFPEIRNKWAISGISDSQLISLLINNPSANIQIAAAHFSLYHKLTNMNLSATITAYNVGIGRVKTLNNHHTHPYTISVYKIIDTMVVPFNQTRQPLSKDTVNN